MDSFSERPHFLVNSIIEQIPFESSAVQSFFIKWCEINDSILPQIIDRDDWEQRGIKGILEKKLDGKQTLYIPKDLQLWEMVGVMEVVDHDTFAAKPNRQDQAKKKLLELGKTFMNAGVYIAQRLNSIDQGREIARALAEEFYDYGESLVSGKQPAEQSMIDDIAAHHLTPSELDVTDHFLAGDNIYKSRQIRAEKAGADDQNNQQDQVYETERQKSLAQFFRVSEKAFALERNSGSEALSTNKAHLKPWQSNTPLHSAFLNKIEQAMEQKIETPKRELMAAIFRRGLEKLVNEMKERGWKHSVNSLFRKLGIDLRVEQKKLADTLHIEQLKTELAVTRQSGNVTQISNKERQIADKIQIAVSSFPYQSSANNPSEMVTNQYINCVGASTLGGVLMREAGLNYLLGDVPQHSILFLVTSDGQIEWRDMLNASFNENLTDGMIKGSNKDGSPLTVAHVVAFSKNPTAEGLMFDIQSKKYKDKLRWIRKGQRQFVTVFEPEYGQQIQILHNTGSDLLSLGHPKEALEAHRQAVALNPKYPAAYNGLGNALLALGRYHEAIEGYRQALAFDPKYSSPFYNLGRALSFVGSFGEAIEAYKKFIDLADKQKDSVWIKHAQSTIAELSNNTSDV